MKESAAPDSPVLTTAEAGRYLKRSRSWLGRHGAELGVIHLGGWCVYRKETLDRWLAEHEARPEPAAVEPTPIDRPRAVPDVVKRLGPINPLTGRPWKVAQS